MCTSKTFVFSALTSQSLCMAGTACDDKAEIYFTNIPADISGMEYLNDRAAEKGYILENADLHSVLKKLAAKDRSIIVLLMDNEDINIQNAMRLSECYAGNDRIQVYCYASSPESEYLMDSLNISNHQKHLNPMKLRRVLPVRREIYRSLSSCPPFESAVTIHGEKWINVVIAGLNEYGMEMLRAVLWFCQMDGFYLRVDVFDRSEDIKGHFAALCPGVMERGFLPRMGEDYYDLHFHPGTDPLSSALTDEIRNLPRTSRVFVDIGNDRENTDLALKLRSFYAGLYMDAGIYASHSRDEIQIPVIQAVVHDNGRASLLMDNALKNYRDQYFQIDTVGRDSDVYSVKNLLDDPVEQTALAVHSKTFDPASFEMHEYFRRSSMASAIHQKFRKKYIKNEDDMALAEHRRWCAYMRSTEGYCYGTSRDDLAKRHPSLSPYADLSLAEKEKDFRMNSQDT